MTDERHDLELLRTLAAEHKASPEQLALLERFDNNRPNQRGLFLTQQEWDDLSVMIEQFRFFTNWMDEDDSGEPPDRVTNVRRQRALAERIIEANQ